MVYIMFVLAAVVAAPIEVTDVGAVVVVEVKMAVQANIYQKSFSPVTVLLHSEAITYI